MSKNGMLLVSVLAHPVESWCQPEIAKPPLAHQSTYGQNIEPHGLSMFPPFGPAIRCRLPRHLRCRVGQNRWLGIKVRCQTVVGSGCGLRLTLWAISLATDLHGFPRIRNGNNPRFERLLVLRWQKVVELRLAGQPGRRFPHECFSKPRFAEFMNLLRGN